ncbi:hypothetical protein E2562_032970, partial [Oryza meyeriana var. granulata]
MASRGRGRGRGRRGGSGYDHVAKHTPHEDFPEIVLPEMTCARATLEEKALIQSTLKFEDFWRTSCYHLEEDVPKKKNDDNEIERYSDRKRKTQSKREALVSYLKLTPSNFPAELVQGEDNQATRSSVGIEAQISRQLKFLRSLKRSTRMETRKQKRMGMMRMNKKRMRIQMMIITRILSLMTMMMTGTKRRKHMKTTMISSHCPLK